MFPGRRSEFSLKKILDRIAPDIPAWLYEHAEAVSALRQSDPEFDEMLVDYSVLVEAIAYWKDRSRARSDEFTALASELEREITQKLIARAV
jgi:hypothetical protein